MANILFKTNKTKGISDLLNDNGTINTNTPIAEGSLYFTSDGKIVYDITDDRRIIMSDRVSWATQSHFASSADALRYQYCIDGVAFDGSINVTHYGECNVGAAVPAKTLQTNILGFSLLKGAQVRIKFSQTNTADDATLNINNTGAKPIMRYGSTKIGKTVATSWNAGEIVTFTYDGTNWVMENFLNTDTNTDTKIRAYAKNITDVYTQNRQLPLIAFGRTYTDLNNNYLDYYGFATKSTTINPLTGELITYSLSISSANEAVSSTELSASIYSTGGISTKKTLAARDIKIDNNKSKGVNLQYDDENQSLNFVFY